MKSAYQDNRWDKDLQEVQEALRPFEQTKDLGSFDKHLEEKLQNPHFKKAYDAVKVPKPKKVEGTHSV